MSSEKQRVTELADLVEGLSEKDRSAAGRIFAMDATTGRLRVPESMVPWVEKSFGSVDAVEEQRIVKVTNRVTLEGTLFNSLRASRPLDTGVDLDLEGEIEATAGDPFCRPEEGTPEDIFGRVHGEYAVSASNVAKYDGFHGVIVFDDHNPLDLTPEKVADYVATGLDWLREVPGDRPGGPLPIPDVELSLAGRWLHHPRPRPGHRDPRHPLSQSRAAAAGSPRLRRRARLGLLRRPLPGPRRSQVVHPRAGRRAGVREPHAFKGEGSRDPGPEPRRRNFRRSVGEALQCYVRDLGVKAFNVAFYMPPVPADEEWSGFPTVVYLVDRGDPANRTSDLGAMELYAASWSPPTRFRSRKLSGKGCSAAARGPVVAPRYPRPLCRAPRRSPG